MKSVEYYLPSMGTLMKSVKHYLPSMGDAHGIYDAPPEWLEKGCQGPSVIKLKKKEECTWKQKML